MNSSRGSRVPPSIFADPLRHQRVSLELLLDACGAAGRGGPPPEVLLAAVLDLAAHGLRNGHQAADAHGLAVQVEKLSAAALQVLTDKSCPRKHNRGATRSGQTKIRGKGTIFAQELGSMPPGRENGKRNTQLVSRKARYQRI